MGKERRENCSRCSHFLAAANDPNVSDREAREKRGWGTCHRYSPRPALRDYHAQVQVVYWPAVRENDFCGEFA